MKVLAVTNLYPRPDQPRRGMFNAQLFAALNAQLQRAGDRGQEAVSLSTLVLVPEARLWKWASIRTWAPPISVHQRSSAVPLSVVYVPVLHLPVIGRNFAWRLHARALRRHKKLFGAADAVLATWLYPDAVAAGIVARECGKPFWVKPHGTDRFHMEHPKRGAKIREVLKDAAGYLPNAQFLADYLAEQGVSSEKVHVIRHGVDHERFRPRTRDDAISALKARGVLSTDNTDGHGLASASLRPEEWVNKKVVLYVGNLEYIKGPDRLLTAFAALRKSAATGADEALRPPASDLRLLVIGDGSWRGKLEQMAKDLDIADDVVFLDSRPHDEVALWMNVADCLCLPSRSEGMPNVVIEALASGCPVVATDVGDVKWLLEDGLNGYVVSNEETSAVDGLADAIGRALDTSWDRHAVSKAAEDLTWEDAAQAVRLEFQRGMEEPQMNADERR